MSRTALAGVGVVTGVALVAAHFSSGDLADAATTDVVATGPGEGGGPRVRTFGPTGQDGGVNYYAAGSPTGGTNIAVADVTGDGQPELITGTGPGSDAEVQVWTRDGKTLLSSVHPFIGFNGGVTVAATNVDETPAAELIVGAGPGGGPHVKVFRLTGNSLSESFGFYAYVEHFSGGVNVGAAGGRIVTGAGPGGGPHVRVWSLFAGQPSVATEWFAFPDFTGGVRVAIGAVRQDNVLDVVTAPGPGIAPTVTLWDTNGVQGPSFMPYDQNFKGGVYVAVTNGKRLVTGAGFGGAPHVKIVQFANEGFSPKASFYAYATDFKGGVKVAGYPAPPLPLTTTTTAGCSGVEFPVLGCLGGASANPTTTTAKPTTTTLAPGATTTTSSTLPPQTSISTTTTTAPAGLLGLPIPIP